MSDKHKFIHYQRISIAVRANLNARPYYRNSNTPPSSVTVTETSRPM